jgi:hypothetical protein
MSIPPTQTLNSKPPRSPDEYSMSVQDVIAIPNPLLLLYLDRFGLEILRRRLAVHETIDITLALETISRSETVDAPQGQNEMQPGQHKRRAAPVQDPDLVSNIDPGPANAEVAFFGTEETMFTAS